MFQVRHIQGMELNRQRACALDHQVTQEQEARISASSVAAPAHLLHIPQEIQRQHFGPSGNPDILNKSIEIY